MTKNYYCEYCDKRFKDDVNIRKRHINGLAHQTARKEHYAQYKEPHEILEEETNKIVCSFFQNGYCQYGVSCRFSHYTPVQLAELQQQVQYIEYKEWLKKQPKQYSKEMIDNFMEKRKQKQLQHTQNGMRHLFNYTDEHLQNLNNLPPSLQLIEPSLVSAEHHQWG